MTNYVTIYEEYRHKFFQLPKVFFTSDRYSNLSNNSKIAWALLRDRSSLSRKNKWFDKDTGRIYFIYKNKELMKILNVKSETTLGKIKKELEQAELIEQHAMGFNRPNKMYLIYPVISEEDIYKIDEIENYEAEPVEKKKSPQIHTGQGTPFNGAPNNGVPYPQNVESSNTELSKTEVKDLDTIDTIDTKIDFSTNENNSNSSKEESERLKKKEEYMTTAFYENREFVPERISNMLSVFSRNTDEAKEYYNVILTAKKKVEKELNLDTIIWLEREPELLHEIVQAFSRGIKWIEKEKKGAEREVENKNGYLYHTIYKVIAEEMSTRVRQSQISKNPIFYNWLEERDEPINK